MLTNGIENATLYPTTLRGGIMSKVKKSLLESIPVLVLLGLLAGAVGGLGIGFIQLKAASSGAVSPPK